MNQKGTCCYLALGLLSVICHAIQRCPYKAQHYHRDWCLFWECLFLVNRLYLTQLIQNRLYFQSALRENRSQQEIHFTNRCERVISHANNFETFLLISFLLLFLPIRAAWTGLNCYRLKWMLLAILEHGNSLQFRQDIHVTLNTTQLICDEVYFIDFILCIASCGNQIESYK